MTGGFKKGVLRKGARPMESYRTIVAADFPQIAQYSSGGEACWRRPRLGEARQAFLGSEVKRDP